MAAANPCCGNCKNDSNEELVSGWKLKDGSLAQLCRQCGFAYMNDIFCETFHMEAEGWRDCAICRKPLHCGCITSENKYAPLDLGGIGCSKCLSEVEQYYASGPMTRLLNPLSDTVFKSKIYSLICSSPTEKIVEPLYSEASKVHAPHIEEQPNIEAPIGDNDTFVDANVRSEILQVNASLRFIPNEKVVDSVADPLKLAYPIESSCPTSFAIVETLHDTSVQNDVKKKRRGRLLGSKTKRKEKMVDLVAEPLKLTYPIETSCPTIFGIVETLDDTSVHNDVKKKRRGRPLGSKTKRKKEVVDLVVEPLKLTYPVETSSPASFGLMETLDGTLAQTDAKKKCRGRPLGSKTKPKDKVVDLVPEPLRLTCVVETSYPAVRDKETIV